METVGIISSFMVAIATVIYVILTYKILKINQKVLLEQTRPYVSLDFYEIDAGIYLRLANLGSRSAKNIQCKIEPPLENYEIKVEQYSYLNEFINRDYLSPKVELIYYINNLGNLPEKPVVFKVKITYEDDFSVKYQEYYSLILDKRITLRNRLLKKIGG